MSEVICPTCGTKRSIDGTEERVRCSSNSCDKRFYVKPNIVVPLLPPKKDKKDVNGTPKKYTTSIINRPNKIQIAIDDVDWITVLKIMDRGISTIRNKSEVKRKKGAYYFDYLKWLTEIKKIEEIASVMKLLEGK